GGGGGGGGGDALNFLFRSYYAIGPMTNPQGESTGALYGFIRSLFKIIKDFSPDHIVVVFDGPDNKKSRTDIYSEYKGHRKAMPEDLYPQLEKAKLFCDLAGISQICVSGVEADDTMGSIALWAEKNDSEAYLCSSDKDLCQLVSDKVFVVNVHKDNLIITKEKVVDLFGVRPEQMIDYLAMVGDASDNIPGLEGFGPKTVVALLAEFTTLEYILDHPENLSGKKKETIVAQKEIALLSKQLATIQLNVDFPKEEEFFRYTRVDSEKLREFYKEMNFMSLIKKEDGASPKPANSHSKAEITTSYQLINDETSLITLIENLKNEVEVCLDVETTGLDPMNDLLVGVGLGVKEGEAFYIPCNGDIPKEKVLKALADLLSAPHTGFYGHNFKYDLHILLNEGLPLPKVGFDTILASYVLRPSTPRHNLDQLTLEKFGKVKVPIEDLIGKGKTQISMLEVPLDKICGYCCEDIDYTIRLKNLFTKELKTEALESVFYDIEIPLIPILLQMERAGIFVDETLLHHMSKDLAVKIQDIENAIYELAGETFNLNSPKQLSVILFEKLGLKAPKKTLTGFSTAADVLESLEDASPIVKKIIEYRTLEKLRSTYVDALPLFINKKTGRIHCTFNQSVTATGRLSCQDPNLQNIPVRSEEGKKIRQAFKPQKPDWLFLSSDYSQIELRLLAHLSDDPALLYAFEKGEDIHAYTASLVFDVPLNEVTPEMRYRAKAVNFGILYGQQAYGLSQELSIDFKEASQFINTYFERYGKVKEYLENCKTTARTAGYAMTITGRKRPIPEINNKNPMIRNAAERLATNTPLQGTAADLIKIAMRQIQEKLNESSIEALMILQIHDELVFEVHKDSVDELSALVKKIMENVFTLKVPLSVDISIGKNWGEC
ncbi:MAG: DNA polymerase I, partial [Chlamydiae bacterium]|nr:DNA polymerase I [Chlamydiota bacterium]